MRGPFGEPGVAGRRSSPRGGEPRQADRSRWKDRQLAAGIVPTDSGTISTNKNGGLSAAVPFEVHGLRPDQDSSRRAKAPITTNFDAKYLVAF
jgi:hypothetical protein